MDGAADVPFGPPYPRVAVEAAPGLSVAGAATRSWSCTGDGAFLRSRMLRPSTSTENAMAK